MNKFDCLQPGLPLLKHHFLEASAGTGKTFAIEHLVTRLILEEGLSLREILIVTFTRAATRELKQRIHAVLQKVVILIKKKEVGSYKYIADLLEKKDHHMLITRGEDALLLFDEAQIFTIHGFCHHLLSRYAFKANVPFKLTSPDASPPLHLKKRMIDFFLKAHASQDLSLALKKFRGDSDALIDHLLQNFSKKTTQEPQDLLYERADLVIKEIAHRYPIQKEQFLHEFSFVASSYKGLCNSKGEIHPKWVKEAEYLAESLLGRRFEKSVSFLSLLVQDNLKVRKKDPTPSLLFKTLSEKLLPLLDKINDPKEAIKRLASASQVWMSDYLAKAQVFQPDDFLKETRRAIADDGLKEKILEEYRVAIIDEFQDTDPVQWEIFATLFLKQGHLYLVGDPKQSIYTFRNADLYTYFQARNLLQKEVSTLAVNFRSVPSLIHILNTLFSDRYLPGWIRLPLEGRQVDYVPVEIHENEMEELKDGKSSFHVLLMNREEEVLFSYIAAEILRLKKTFSLNYSSVAILVKDRFQEERLFNYLKAKKIPVKGKRVGHISDTLAYEGLFYVLKALHAPHDIIALKTALAAPLFGWKEHELKEEEEKIDEAYLLFQKLRFELEKGFSHFFNLLIKHILPHPMIEKDLYHLAELLMESNSDEYFQTLKEFKQFDPEKDLRFAIRDQGGEDRVVLMTTYASKGLEFDVVFPIGLSFRHEEEAIDLEKEAEKMRLLYVGLTRAKKRIYLPFIFEDKINMGSASSTHILMARLKQDTLSEEQVYTRLRNVSKENMIPLLEEMSITYEVLENCLEVMPFEKNSEERPLTPISFTVNPFSPIYFHSFSSLAKEKGDISFTQDIAHLPIGSETGRLVHLLIEKIIKYSLHHPFQEEKVKKLIRVETQLSSLKEFQDVLYSLIFQAFHTPLIQGACLKDLTTTLFCEMEFLFPSKGHFLTGCADLFFEWKDKYYILDWKTNFLGNDKSLYERENLKKVMEENDYFLQAAIYSDAACRYLRLFNREEQFGGAIYVFLRGINFGEGYGLFYT